MKPVKPLRSVFVIGSMRLVVSPPAIVLAAILLLILVILMLALLSIGKTSMTASELVCVIRQCDDVSVLSQQIIWNIRLPRVLTATFVGAALAVSGTIFQSISRNPLGSPDIIGFTTGAASGAMIQIVLFGQQTYAVMLAAVSGGLFTVLLVYWLARAKQGLGSYRLILIGIGVGSILSAFNGLLLVKGNLDQAVMANLWLAGSLSARHWGHVLPVTLGCLLIIPLVLLSVRQLNMMEMGDEIASQLGIQVERSRFLMMFYAVLLAALATGAAGPIAFIALAAPQLVAYLLPGQAGRSILCSALMGACLLVSTDLISQLLPTKITLPIGRMTGVIGGLYLIWLLGRLKRI